MNIFLDTSILFKLYHQEKGSQEVDAFLSSHEIEHLYISEATLVEFCSAVTKKFRMNEITLEQADNLVELFEKDYSSYKVIGVNNALLTKAKSLVLKYKTEGLRTLDAIQLASAITMKHDIAIVMTSDDRLTKIANLEGLKTE